VTTVAVTVAGSTGSIGVQTLNVIRHASPDAYRVVALTAGGSKIDELAKQVGEVSPTFVAVPTEGAAKELRNLVGESVEIGVGDDALAHASTLGDVTVNGVVGFAGLPVTLATLSAGKRLALANKESLIAGGPVVQGVRQTPGAEIIPVDSEHCAIHQCLRAGAQNEVHRLVLTSSGGPFRGRSHSELSSVTVEQALAHPTWNMGPKITIDSSTLMNKGLEVIEAHELFGVGYDNIDVVVHPQSMVHSMVTFTDGSTVAQLSEPDMRLPIAYALCWPLRSKVPVGAIDWATPQSLTFEAPDRQTFGCLDLAYEAGRLGGGAPAWLNGANEVAVQAFLDGKLAWVDIARVVSETLMRYQGGMPTCVGDVLEADAESRRQAVSAINRKAS
jgi:1-deoxy-D-xylulose-5-phosphate reductoisomerase